jgi:hypothetical protein
MDITLTQEEYETLVTLARLGIGEDKLPLEKLLLESIETRNGVKRYLLVVQWQEADGVIPIGAEFPKKWPAEMRMTIEQLNVPISRKQVEDLVGVRARKPVSILVTSDPNGLVGWSTLDQWFEVKA